MRSNVTHRFNTTPTYDYLHTHPTSAKSWNSNSSVSHCTNSNWDFGLLWISTEECEFLDLVDFMGVAFSMETVIVAENVFCKSPTGSMTHVSENGHMVEWCHTHAWITPRTMSKLCHAHEGVMPHSGIRTSICATWLMAFACRDVSWNMCYTTCGVLTEHVLCNYDSFYYISITRKRDATHECYESYRTCGWVMARACRSHGAYRNDTGTSCHANAMSLVAHVDETCLAYELVYA